MHKIALSIDVEDWFAVRNLSGAISADRWNECEQRLSEGLDFVLEELDRRRILATFFVLGWAAEQNPECVRRIADAGHEIASHGYSHQGLDLLTPESFDHEIKRANRVLTGITGKPVLGFRAPSFSLTEKTFWALDVLRENGIRYDSSIFTIRHPNYGIPSFAPRIQRVNGVVEYPLSAVSVAGMKVPVAGGGYFRLFPYAVTRRLLRRVLRERPMVMYFHPWEFDPGQPRVAALSATQRFRHYVGLNRNRTKFCRLLDEFEFYPMAAALAENGFDLAAPQ